MSEKAARIDVEADVVTVIGIGKKSRVTSATKRVFKQWNKFRVYASKIASMEEDESMDSDHNVKVDNDIKNDTAIDLGEGADDDGSAKAVMKNRFALLEDAEELDQ
nr:GTP-binding family protein [Tanacetum cinerariifolium]